VPGHAVKDDFNRILARREELEALLTETKAEPVLLHPNVVAHYREQVAALNQALTSEENRAEAADLLRSLIDRIELTPNAESKLEVDLYGDLAGILALTAAKENGPPREGGPFQKQQDKVVAGAGFEPATFRL
jgi:site-specific DNA recombinase